MADKEKNVVLNFKMDGQIQYAKTLREINAIMNTAAKEYKNHVAAMGDDASATDKLRAEKKKLEVQLEAAQKRTQMLREQYEQMSKSTKTTTGQLAQMYSKLLDSERAEMSLQKSLDRVNEGLSDEAQEARNAKEVLNQLQNESKTLDAEQKNLISSFKLQNAQLGENASEAEKTELAQKQLSAQIELTNRVVNNLERQLEQAKKIYGENSVEVKQLETKINQAKTEIAEFGNKLEGIKSSGNKAEQGIEGINKKLSAAVFLEASEQLQGISDKLLDIGKNAVEMGMSLGDSQTYLQANLGKTSKEAEKLNEVVKNVFKNGVVESVDDAAEAVMLVKQQFGDLNNTELEKLTNEITTISKRTGTDVKDNVLVAKRLMKEFGLSGQEALDIIAAGFSSGLNITDDFLDTLNEYSPHFEAAGYSAKQMLQILNNGLENGSLNADKAADAVKEFQIKLGDGSFQDIVKNFSKDTQKTFEEWKKGKATVADVAESVSKDLNKMTPSKQQEALSLLSSQFEDLGIDGAKALFSVGKEFDNINGKAEEMSKKSPGEKWQSSLRELQTTLEPIGTDIVNSLVPVVEKLSDIFDWFGKLPEPIQTFIEVFGGVTAVALVLAPAIAAVALAITSLDVALLPIIAIVAAVAAAIAGIIVVIKNWGKITDWISDKWQQMKNWLSEKTGEMKEAVVNKFNDLREKAGNVISTFKSNVINKVDELKSDFINKANELKNGAINKFSNLKDKVVNIISTFKTNVINKVNDLKSGFVNKVNELKNGVISKFQSLSSSISNTMTKVKSAIQNGWSKAVAYLKGINLKSIGKNIIEGLINGIKSKMAAVVSAVKNIANKILKTLTGELEIHSPSKKTERIAYWLMEGLTKGITAHTKAEKAAKAKAQAIVKEFNANLKDIKLDYKTGKISTTEYIASLKKLKNEYKNYSTGVKNINAEITKAQNQSIKERFASDKTYYSNKSKLSSTSLQEELDILNKLAKGYKKNTEERIYFENLAKQKKEEITKAKKKIDEDYLANVKKLNEEYLSEVQRLNDEYEKAVDDRAKTLYNFIGLFDEVKESEEITGQQLIENLQGQVDTLKQWTENIKTLIARGVDEGLIKELEDMGPSAATQIAALTTLSDEELNQFVSLWREKSSLARTQAIEELEDMRIETEEKLEQLKEETAKKLEQYQDEWKTSMKSVTGTVKNMANQMPSIGSYAISGLIDGMNSKKAELKAVANEISSIVSSINATGTNIASFQSSGLNIDWHAKGGIFTRPTIFGMSGSRLQGAGEAGPEAVLPLNEETLGTIGKAIAGTMKGGNTFNIYSRDDANAIAKATERALRRVAFQL